MSSPQQHLIFLTNRVGRQLSRLLLEGLEFEGYVPQPTHMGLLADLIEMDGLRQQDLAIATIKDKATITRSVQSLEEAGVLRREVDPNDRRQKRIYVTDRGHRLWAYVNQRSERAMDLAMEGVSSEQSAICVDVLQQVYQNLYQQLNTPPAIPTDD